jgi:hypothetical protein
MHIRERKKNNEKKQSFSLLHKFVKIKFYEMSRIEWFNFFNKDKNTFFKKFISVFLLNEKSVRFNKTKCFIFSTLSFY